MMKKGSWIWRACSAILLFPSVALFPSFGGSAAHAREYAVVRIPVESMIASRCWREGRRCANLIVNGAVDPAPAGIPLERAIEQGYEPAIGPWVFEQPLGPDRRGDPSSASLLFTPGGRGDSLNDEYEAEFHPKFKPGRYRFTFWIMEDEVSVGTNALDVQIKVRDWWGGDEMPEGATRCYSANEPVDTSERREPDVWRKYTFAFSVPLKPAEWDSFAPMDECVDADLHSIPHYDPLAVIPGGYAVKIYPNSRDPMVAGKLLLDDFVLERVGE